MARLVLEMKLLLLYKQQNEVDYTGKNLQEGLKGKVKKSESNFPTSSSPPDLPKLFFEGQDVFN